jgi:diadenosine tetraphosphate (Ap4A) HIT family hydrolase
MSMRTLNFLDGTQFIVDEEVCRGCFMNNPENKLPELLEPILEDRSISVRQDAEWSVPGFYIIGIREHCGSFGDLDLQAVQRISMVMHYVRKAMKEALNIEVVHIIQEEKLINAHLHIWLLPLWPQIIATLEHSPRICASNIMEYIELFSFEQEKERIQKCNAEMKIYLRNIKALEEEGFVVP